MRVRVRGEPRHAAPRGTAGASAISTTCSSRPMCLSLHCPLTATTKHMIGAPQLKRMKRDALLINTARGGLIDSEALAARVARPARSAAPASTCSRRSRRPATTRCSRPTFRISIVTPHVAWSAQEARQRAIDQVTENIADVLARRGRCGDSSRPRVSRPAAGELDDVLAAAGRLEVVRDEHERRAGGLVQVEQEVEDLSRPSCCRDCPSARPRTAATGRSTNARAIATRCFSPPESCFG